MQALRTRVTSRVLGAVAADHRLPASGAHVVLTYDDGPDPEHTPAVLSALQEHGATATFFVLLTRCRRTPSLLADLVDAGHEVALHGPDHRPLSDFSPAATTRRLLDAKAELEDLAQVDVQRYRPPYGLLTVSGTRAVRAGRMRTLLWSRDFQDWVEATEQDRVAAAADGARPGDVLLAHDAHATADDGAVDGAGPVLDRGRLSRAVLLRLHDAGLTGVSAARLTG